MQVGHGVVAEEEAHARVGVPAVEVLGLREVGVAAQQHAGGSRPRKQTARPRSTSRGRAFVRGPVARAVDEAQHLAGVGQGHDQRVIAPGAVVGDVHALLALAGGLDQRAVHVDDGLVEERRPAARPRPCRRVSSKMSCRVSMSSAREAAAEVAGGGGIGDAACAQGVEEDLVVAAQFEVLQAGAVAQGVVGEVEDVVGLVIGQMDLEQVQAVVDGVDQAELAGQEHGWRRCRRGRCRGCGRRSRSGCCWR